MALTLDTLRCEAVCGTITVKLTIKENQLLEFPILNSWQALAREQILQKVWGFDREVEINNIDIKYVTYERNSIFTNVE